MAMGKQSKTRIHKWKLAGKPETQAKDVKASSKLRRREGKKLTHQGE